MEARYEVVIEWSAGEVDDCDLPPAETVRDAVEKLIPESVRNAVTEAGGTLSVYVM